MLFYPLHMHNDFNSSKGPKLTLFFSLYFCCGLHFIITSKYDNHISGIVTMPDIYEQNSVVYNVIIYCTCQHQIYEEH